MSLKFLSNRGLLNGWDVVMVLLNFQTTRQTKVPHKGGRFLIFIVSTRRNTVPSQSY